MSMTRSISLDETSTKPATGGSFRFRTLDAAAVALFLVVLAAMSWRLYEHRPQPGPASKELWALASFRDAVYYPIQAVSVGVNPYDTVRNDDPRRYMQRFPVTDTLPLYSPLILLVFAPFALLPVEASILAFTVLNVILFLLLSWLTLRAIGQPTFIANVFGLATFLLASQPGRGAFYSGQVVLPLALASIGALQWSARRGWRAATLVAFSTLKPTFGGPLGVLLAGRRDWRAAIGGTAIGGALCIAGMLLIFARSGTESFEQAIEVLVGNQSDFYQDPTVVPQNNKGRIDLVTAVEYLVDRSLPGWVTAVVASLVLGLTCRSLWRARLASDDKTAISTASAVMILAMYICIYHNVYDLPLLIVPVAACATAAHSSWRHMSTALRRATLCLMVLPFVNFLWTESFRHFFERVLSDFGQTDGGILFWMYRFTHAANGFSLAIAWGILIFTIERRRKAPSSPPAVQEELAPALQSVATSLTY